MRSPNRPVFSKLLFTKPLSTTTPCLLRICPTWHVDVLLVKSNLQKDLFSYPRCMTRAVLSSPEDHYGSFKCPYQPLDSSLARSNQIWEGITVHCPVAPATYRLERITVHCPFSLQHIAYISSTVWSGPSLQWPVMWSMDRQIHAREGCARDSKRLSNTISASMHCETEPDSASMGKSGIHIALPDTQQK